MAIYNGNWVGMGEKCRFCPSNDGTCHASVKINPKTFLPLPIGLIWQQNQTIWLKSRDLKIQRPKSQMDKTTGTIFAIYPKIKFKISYCILYTKILIMPIEY